MNKIVIYMKIRRDINIPVRKIIKYMSYQPQPPVRLLWTEARQMAH